MWKRPLLHGSGEVKEEQVVEGSEGNSPSSEESSQYDVPQLYGIRVSTLENRMYEPGGH